MGGQRQRPIQPSPAVRRGAERGAGARPSEADLKAWVNGQNAGLHSDVRVADLAAAKAAALVLIPVS